MAKCKFGMMMTDARGKLGGHVFTKTRSSATIRTKVTPTNPQTEAQQTARSLFGSVSQAWRALTEEQRVAWNSAVNDYSRTNIFGDNYLPSGKNLFVSVNSNLLSVGYISLDSPAAPADMPPFIAAGSVVNVTDEELTTVFSSAFPGTGYAKILEATKPSSAGKFNFSGGYARISVEIGSTPLAPDFMYQNYVAKFGVPQPGQKISFRWSYVNMATGQRSVPSVIATIVTT